MLATQEEELYLFTLDGDEEVPVALLGNRVALESLLNSLRTATESTPKSRWLHKLDSM